MTSAIVFPSAQRPPPIVDTEVTAVRTDALVTPPQYNAPSVVEPTKPMAIRSIITDEQIDKLGGEAIQKTSGVNRKILEGVKTTDTGEFGTKLNQLISTAKELTPGKMKGGFLSRLGFGSPKEAMFGKYETVSKRMDALKLEIRASSELMKKRILDQEAMFEDNFQQHEALEQVVLDSQQILAEMQTMIAAAPSPTDAFEVQTLRDEQAKAQRLEKRIDDLLRVMQLAKLAAPEIRNMQNTNRALVSNFTTIETTTLPAYEGVFARYVMSLETAKAGQLQTDIMNATDEAFRMQADQLRQNMVTSAKIQQQSVVSVETIEHMQQQLLGAMDDVLKIEQDGAAARAAALPKLKSLETELIARFSSTKLIGS